MKETDKPEVCPSCKKDDYMELIDWDFVDDKPDEIVWFVKCYACHNKWKEYWKFQRWEKDE